MSDGDGMVNPKMGDPTIGQRRSRDDNHGDWGPWSHNSPTQRAEQLQPPMQQQKLDQQLQQRY